MEGFLLRGKSTRLRAKGVVPRGFCYSSDQRCAVTKDALLAETEKADAKRHDLKAIICESLRTRSVDNADLLADQVLQRFANVTAPYYESGPARLIVLGEGGIGGGSTTKPGNIVLNCRKLVKAIATGTLTIAGATTARWLLLVGALVVWDDLWSCLNLKLTEEHACVVWTLWKNPDKSNTVPKSSVLLEVNRERAEFGKQPLSALEADRVLSDLVKMGCIRQSTRNPQRWWLQEWVRISYK
jgi:hypothetical protein